MAPALLLLLLLSVPPAPEGANVSVSEQRVLRCHSCEAENNFDCDNPRECQANQLYCVITAIKILPRFYMVSKQCSVNCPIIEIPVPPPPPKTFLLSKPTPFLYARCCQQTLCNQDGPPVNKTIPFRDFLSTSAGQLGTGQLGIGLALPLWLATAGLGVCLP